MERTTLGVAVIKVLHGVDRARLLHARASSSLERESERSDALSPPPEEGLRWQLNHHLYGVDFAH
jgi:hypothetical protein